MNVTFNLSKHKLPHKSTSIILFCSLNVRQFWIFYFTERLLVNEMEEIFQEALSISFSLFGKSRAIHHD